MRRTYLIQRTKPYPQYLFRCKIPKDLVMMFPQKVISLSVKSNSYKHSKIICFNLYKTTQFIFDEVRQGIMQDITLEDVKVILREKVRQQSNTSICMNGKPINGMKKNYRKGLMKLMTKKIN